MAQSMIRAPIGGCGGETNSPVSVMSMMRLSSWSILPSWPCGSPASSPPEPGLWCDETQEGAGMQVGLVINTQCPEGYDVGARVPEMVEQVRAARDAGFKSLWFPHH